MDEHAKTDALSESERIGRIFVAVLFFALAMAEWEAVIAFDAGLVL
jgi:uncharacterized integral membrane protein